MLKFDKKSKFTVYLADTLSVINMKYDNVSLSFYTDGNFKLELINSYDHLS